MTWSSSPGELVLCFNRDEQHSRAESLPPRVWPEKFLAPVDAAAGGTWLAVRSDGLVLALLNHYPSGFRRRSQAWSRGALVTTLAGMEVRPTAAVMRDAGLARMNPFRLVVLGLDEVPEMFTWDGRRLVRRALDSGLAFVTSSSWNTRAVTAARQALFRKWRLTHPTPNPAKMRGFHGDAAHSRGSPWAVCMSREDARSVSLNTVRVTPRRAVMTQQFREREADSFSGAVHRATLTLSPSR